MENTIEYKGYIGQFNYESGDQAFHGVVLGLKDVIHFQGACVAELKRSLAESVDDYLAWCEEEEVAPQKPYTGRFILRITPDLHRTISVRAKSAGVSLNQWVAQALWQQAEGGAAGRPGSLTTEARSRRSNAADAGTDGSTHNRPHSSQV